MNPNYLDFEQPIAELEVKIEELQLVGSDNDINVSAEIDALRDKSTKLTELVHDISIEYVVSVVLNDSRHQLFVAISLESITEHFFIFS